MIAEFNPQFSPVAVTGEQIVEVARSFVGLRYSKNTFAAKAPRGGMVGFCDCAGLFLLVALELGLVPADFDPNLPPALTGVSRETALREILLANFRRVAPGALDSSMLQSGDLLRLKWPEQTEDDGRHMAIWTGGGLIHSLNYLRKSGSVREEPLEAHTLPLVQRCYRLKSLMAAGTVGVDS